MAGVIGAVKSIRQSFSWAVYDPQRGELVHNLDELVSHIASEMRRISGFVDKRIAPRPPPWWKFWSRDS